MAVRSCGGSVSIGRNRGERNISFTFGRSAEYRLQTYYIVFGRSRNGRYITIGVHEGSCPSKFRSKYARVGCVHVWKSIESRSLKLMAVFPGRTVVERQYALIRHTFLL